MTEKTVDIYKDAEFVAKMVERYKAAGTSDADEESREAVVSELSDETGKSKASIRQKLHREGVYIAKKTRKSKEVVTKQQLVDRLIEAMGLDLTESEASSFEKATKQALIKAVARAREMQREILGDEEVAETEEA